jgi:signal transduction histidine kinase
MYTFVLLYVTPQSVLSDVLIWVAFALLFVGSLVLFFWQRRVGRGLVHDVEILDQIKDRNVQNEFVLKALRIATWHMEVSTGEIAYDNDFRERTNEWIADASVTNGVMERGVSMLHEQDGPRVAQALTNLCMGLTEEYHEEYRVRIPNTSRVYWEESYATIAERGDDGKPTMIVGTSKRIDDRKTMEKALSEARYRAEESDRLKTAFLANMSHEVRTPLNAIVGFTSLLPDVTEPEERKQLLDLINENTQKLLTIVDDVVSISKVESGQNAPMFTTFDLCIALTEVVDLFVPKLKMGVTLTTDFAVPALNISSDRSRVVDVMRHLVSNAVKFTDNGSIVVGFDMPEGGQLRIWVKDTGKGIAPELHERVFERFFKVDEFIPGAGLGLSTCRTLAYSIGATVLVDSALGEGSTFSFELPTSGSL